MEIDNGDPADESVHQRHETTGKVSPTSPSRTEDDAWPVQCHMLILSILLSRIIFLTRSAILTKLAQKNRKIMIDTIGIAISQNLARGVSISLFSPGLDIQDV